MRRVGLYNDYNRAGVGYVLAGLIKFELDWRAFRWLRRISLFSLTETLPSPLLARFHWFISWLPIPYEVSFFRSWKNDFMFFEISDVRITKNRTEKDFIREILNSFIKFPNVDGTSTLACAVTLNLPRFSLHDFIQDGKIFFLSVRKNSPADLPTSPLFPKSFFGLGSS